MWSQVARNAQGAYAASTLEQALAKADAQSLSNWMWLQVARNAQGADAASTLEQALAEADARTALAAALNGLCPDDASKGALGGSEEGYGGSSYGSWIRSSHIMCVFWDERKSDCVWI